MSGDISYQGIVSHQVNNTCPVSLELRNPGDEDVCLSICLT